MGVRKSLTAGKSKHPLPFTIQKLYEISSTYENQDSCINTNGFIVILFLLLLLLLCFIIMYNYVLYNYKGHYQTTLKGGQIHHPPPQKKKIELEPI